MDHRDIHSQLYRDIHTVQNIIQTLRDNITYTTESLHSSLDSVEKMVEALVNIKQFALNTIQPLDAKLCKNKDCKEMQERLEKTLRSIVDIVNHSMQPN